MILEEDLKFVPVEYHDMLKKAHEGGSDSKELVQQLEAFIKKHHGIYMKPVVCHIGLQHNRGNENWKERVCLLILLDARRRVLNRMFRFTEESYKQFETINTTLFDLSNETVRKTMALYDEWLKEEEEAWKNDSEVYGKIEAEGWNEEMPSDETGSDYESMIEIIEDISDRELFRIEFSGHPDRTSEEIRPGGFLIDAERDFRYGEDSPFGTFRMCEAFEKLYYETLYSNSDILHIKMYWADVAVVHQRIVSPCGELL